MAKKKTKTDWKNLQQDVIDSAHRIWLAGLGALSTVEEEGSKRFQLLVERGRDVEKKGREQVSRMRSDVEARVKEARTKVESSVDEAGESLEERLSQVLQKFGVPTRDEIEGLTKRVEDLNAKVDQLKGKGAAPVKKAAPAKKPAAASSTHPS